jgi:molybdopterin molybdotransferase
MSQEFLQLIPVDEVLRLFHRFRPIERIETLPLLEAVGRVTADAVVAGESLPAFPRALMDGFAVRAADVASARETSPVFLRVAGEVAMGQVTQASLQPGECIAVATGAMVPPGADAVAMVEHTRPGPDGTVEFTRAAAAHDHLLLPGEDVAQGTQVFAAGRRVCPLDVGALSALGISRLRVRARPVVAIVSTGDELVEPSARPAPGQVRDTNGGTLHAQVQACGGIPLLLGRVPDTLDALRAAVAAARGKVDLLLLSGGSSMGTRDHTAQVLSEQAGNALLVHGIAIAPGKPTLLADLGGVPAFGLPGHPVSSFVVFHVVVSALLRRLAGELRPPLPKLRRTRLRANVVAAVGRETYVPVRLEEDGRSLRAVPTLGNSAVHSSLLQCDGLVRIPLHQEGWAQGDEVDVEVLR